MEQQKGEIGDMYVSVELSQQMINNRESLRVNRNYVYKKLMKYLEMGNVPDNPVCARIDWAIGWKCNFKCPHCFAKDFSGKGSNRTMSIDQIRDVAQQADEAGVFMINLIGGEPLIGFDFDEVIRVLDPNRFRLAITTNGWMLSKERALHLAEIGVDRVCISVDSAIPEEHDSFRGVKGAHARAMAAIRNSLDAGMVTQVATVITHQNLHSEGITRLFKIINDMGVYMDVPVAAPCGGWIGNLDVLIDEDDAAYIRELRKEYPLLRRDIFPSPGLQGGCFAVKQTLYIIPTGDVLPCLLIHSSLGNIFEMPLSKIRERGLKIEAFNKYSGKCLAGEDYEFIDKYLSRTFKAKELPLSYEEGWL